ncbi:MAG: PIG-L family deacetylase [Syntrophobacter sp.]
MTRLIFMILLALAVVFPSVSWAEEPNAIEALISPTTRLMIFSPHPDDETLGAGGLIQRIIEAGGRVRVVFMTSGDGFPEGVKIEDHTSTPTPEEYRIYGEERRLAALKVLSTLGVKKRDVIFLGFPDGGLTSIRSKYIADPQSYRCPYTLRSRPPVFERIIPNTDYNGKDLKEELIRVIEDYHPTLVATTPPYDQHPDHNSTYYFVKEALSAAFNDPESPRPHVLTFLIHYFGWPTDQEATGLEPPANFHKKETLWIPFPLKPEEVETKREAITLYHSQMEVMSRFLLSFARPNELFVLDE